MTDMMRLPELAFHREYIYKFLLNQTCNVRPQATTSSDAFGIVTQVEQPLREWRGSTDIPCYLDTARAFMNDPHKQAQATVTDIYHLDVPKDFEMDESDIIIIGGDEFRARRGYVHQEEAMVREYYVTRVERNG